MPAPADARGNRMSDRVRIRAYEIDGRINVKCIVDHPMETGFRKIRKTGKKVPAHYITDIVVSHNNRTIMEANWGISVSRNPYLSFQMAGKRNDFITVAWIDNRGESGTATERVR